MKYSHPQAPQIFRKMRYTREMRILWACAVLTAGLTGVGPAAAQKVEVTDRDCRQIVNYVAPPDVAYQPGVDAQGRPVAPADLNPSPVQLPQTLVMDVNIDLRKYGVPSHSPLLLPGVAAGQITIEDGGRRVYYNGQPLGDAEEKVLAELCRQHQLPRR